ncbi:hypothetical protein LAUMK21_04750 [Mycobacterium pseudokansasii]|nr:hypothetical protein LAUMK21_04750 [Mycobacterium pseudokansasii]
MPAVTPQPGRPAGPAAAAIGTAGNTCYTGPTVAAGSAVAIQQPAVTAGSAGRARPTGTAEATVAPQPGVTASAAGHPGAVAVVPVAAIAEQQSPGLPVGVRCVAIGAVTDQRATQQQLRGRIHQIEQFLHRQHIGRLGTRIRGRARSQSTHNLIMKRRHLGAQRLIFAGIAIEKRRDRRRHLILGGRQQAHRRDRCGGVGLADCRTDNCHIQSRCRHDLRRQDNQRHSNPPMH